MAGVSEIAKEISARCPYCHRSLNLQQLGRELFRRILLRLVKGERVEAEGFGRFRTHIMPGRDVSALKTGITRTSDRVVLRFKSAVRAREALNEDTETKPIGSTTWRKHVKAK